MIQLRWNGVVRRTLLGAIVVHLVLAGCCFGAQEAPERGDEAKFYVGAGAVVISKPYEGVDAKVYPVPMFGYEGDRLYLRGIVAGYRLIRGEKWSAGPILRPRFEGYEQDDSSALAGMADRDPSLDIGLDASWQADFGLLRLVFVTDLLSRHDGQELELSYARRLLWQGCEITPSVALRWRSNNLVDYYYGVRADEAGAGRDPYRPDDTVNPVVRLTVRRMLSARWGALFGAQYEWFGDEIRDSPIVDDSGTFSFLVGVAYSF